VAGTDSSPSARQLELLERAYRYVLANGLTDMSLRPLAQAIESSPRVLLFLFGSKDGLVRALLGRAREEELALLNRLNASSRNTPVGLAAVTEQLWSWLAADEHRALLRLWVEGYGRSLTDPDGPWAEFARSTVDDWLAVLAAAQPPAERRTRAANARRTLALAVLRGALLDLLATDDLQRTTAAVRQHLASLGAEDLSRAAPHSGRARTSPRGR
jgi:AcrR family transcriptional regulator